MDQNMQATVQKKMERTAKALERNRFDTFLIQNREELFDKLRELMPKGVSCSVGGAQTLFEAGVIDFLKSGDYDYLDRYAEGADVPDVFHKALSCDVYLMSSNAITEEGELYNVDGTGNRVAAMTYGPAKVVVIAGHNKIVPDLEAARMRNRKTAAPANCMRLNIQNPCYHTGTCGDCHGDTRICNFELTCKFNRIPHRITVLLVNEELGY